MHVVDRHRKAVEFANERTADKFGCVGPYEPGSRQHTYWLAAYDNYVAFH